MTNKCTSILIVGILIPILLNGCSSRKNRAHLDPKVFPPQVEEDQQFLLQMSLDFHYPGLTSTSHKCTNPYPGTRYSTRSIFDEHGWLSSNNVEPRSWFIIMGLLYQRLQFIWRTTQLADYARNQTKYDTVPQCRRWYLYDKLPGV